jgi:hypothetical protein
VSKTSKSQSDRIRESAEAHLAAFRIKPTEPTSRAILRDSDMEGQMRSLASAGLCFQLGFSTTVKATAGTCVAVGYQSNGEYRMRIYRKTEPGRWTQHTFALQVMKQRQQRNYVWVSHAPQSSGQLALPTVARHRQAV